VLKPTSGRAVFITTEKKLVWQDFNKHKMWKVEKTHGINQGGSETTVFFVTPTVPKATNKKREAQDALLTKEDAQQIEKKPKLGKSDDPRNSSLSKETLDSKTNECQEEGNNH
jgi:hypothetical protein